MVSALRKIRKKLLEEKRAQRYFFYAIGEIVLVVIGILIALQINTWNKEKQNRVLETTILENLKEDLEIQKELIQEQIDFETSILIQVDSAKTFVSDTADKTVLERLFRDLGARRTFKANRATFSNMISSGSINLIANADLQNKIVRYFQRLDYTESVVNNNNLYMVDSNFGAFVANNGLGLEVDENNNIVATTKFTNKDKATILSQLTYRSAGSDSVKNLSETLLQVTNDLIREIEHYLQ
ncbi:hypothetical protein C1T31_11505 [Hanstruepera neustonica]|uniref:Uncharacterized protein n=1 Tax=Hanstruepera neustonica TaxID=1445657 RepID=A0A2K1DWK9_9FLAO|nr:DUF6090 family protein [Hanstruepera neustonica]PNQ72414.1 hypothetical protein C1T31_11505 [Hanstruepera neustonica]